MSCFLFINVNWTMRGNESQHWDLFLRENFTLKHPFSLCDLVIEDI